MMEVLMENVIQILGALLATLLGVLGSWLSLKLGRCRQLQAINEAQREAIGMAQLTVGELQQTLVEGMKAAHADGRLSSEEIAMLGRALREKTIAKMSRPARQLLDAAGVDVIALIQGAGEDWIRSLS